jgi:transcriptional regulator with XRE-family HTH domain
MPGGSTSAGSDLEQGSAEHLERSSIGDYLRRQRVLRDVSIEELSALTRIPQRSLERLERGEFDGQPDGFARGFVRTVAQALGLDVDDTVARMLDEPAVGVWERGINSGRLQRVAVLLALALAVGTGALVLRAGWRLLAGPASGDPSSAVVVWRDPVHALAEATGAEVDPAREIDPARGSRSPSPPPRPRRESGPPRGANLP